MIVAGLALLEYDYISSRRIRYFCSSKPLFHQLTILVRAIPALAGRSIGDSVENSFTLTLQPIQLLRSSNYYLSSQIELKMNHMFVNVYAPKYGTGGKFWEIAHSCMIFLYYSCMVSLWEYTH
ncbi:uncharacterized protein LOC107990804 [Cucumis melo]|uniref:Uncharacterized protein LOC107990804 n=1 Tax=Cucumis melo TaxID=3656 RepID=A0ABM3LAQ3_CUCME|nr:uncharacterized protein LOC107990804 [Cucumis melo]